MSDMSVALGDLLFEYLCDGSQFPTPPTDMYACLYNGDPEAGGTEITGGNGLTRQAVVWGTTTSRQRKNADPVEFGTAAADSGTGINYVALRSAAVGGTLYAKKSISTLPVNEGVIYTVAEEALVLTY